MRSKNIKILFWVLMALTWFVLAALSFLKGANYGYPIGMGVGSILVLITVWPYETYIESLKQYNYLLRKSNYLSNKVIDELHEQINILENEKPGKKSRGRTTSRTIRRK